MPQASSESIRQIDSLRPSEKLGNSPRFIAFTEKTGMPEVAAIFTPQTPYVYVSAEYGIPGFAYAGGLGVLAGDHVRSIDEIEAPFVGIGLRRSERNMQVITTHIDPEDGSVSFTQIDKTVPLPTPEKLGLQLQEHIKVMVHGEFGDSQIAVYKYPLVTEQSKMYLLDDPGQVYPGEPKDSCRLWDNAVLGFGGYQIVRQLEVDGKPIDPALFHINESAASLFSLAVVNDLTTRYGGDDAAYDRALAEVRKKSLLTNHTLVPAAEASYSAEQCRAFILSNTKGIARDRIEGFIRQRDEALNGKREDPNKYYLMLRDLAFYLSGNYNAVSGFHAEIGTGNFQQIYGKDYYGNKVEFSSVTNGVDIQYWNKPMRDLFVKHDVLDEFDLPNNRDSDEFRRRIMGIKTEELMQERAARARELCDYLEQGDRVDQFGKKVVLPEDAIIIGDGRRMADYKQREIMFRNHDRLKQYLLDHPRVHIFIAGKAHPTDSAGKEIAGSVLNHIASDELFMERIHFMQDWDIELSQKLIPAVDVWMNNPRVGEEACGTSPMKAGLGGAVLVSTPDGFFPELEDGSYIRIKGAPRSSEETDSYYTNLEKATEIAENPEVAAFYARRLWVGGLLRIACGPAMLARYFDLLTRKQRQEQAEAA